MSAEPLDELAFGAAHVEALDEVEDRDHARQGVHPGEQAGVRSPGSKTPFALPSLHAVLAGSAPRPDAAARRSQRRFRRPGGHARPPVPADRRLHPKGAAARRVVRDQRVARPLVGRARHTEGGARPRPAHRAGGSGAAVPAARQARAGPRLRAARRRRTDDIARRFFVPGEQRRLFSLSPVEREQAFFRLWTCKEAFLKVTGEGLSRSTRSYEVEVGPDGARLLWATGIHDAAERFSVYPLDPGNGYAAALFAEARGLTLRRFHWP
ncbi:MAG: 4'-phosphopantetheinyl transferase superfamily protein [Deltaproteobacteria bacterium]|nr:MAG: 4'-phosphopantetheinyl transferase superfamily protein [Deltaproteobacteria bacterium]